jgi:putative hydrolase of HD superfamily
MHINIGLTEYMQNVDSLRNLVRYQSAPRVSTETVAEHSYFVAAYVLKLHNYYEFDLKKALSMAILHDYAEVFISDVPHPIKKQFPLIEEELNRAEHSIVCDHISEEFADWLDEFNKTSTVEGCIVALADILSVISYARYEIGLGNSVYMKNVLTNAKNRAQQMFKNCEKYLYDNISQDDVEINVCNFAYSTNTED